MCSACDRRTRSEQSLDGEKKDAAILEGFPGRGVAADGAREYDLEYLRGSSSR